MITEPLDVIARVDKETGEANLFIVGDPNNRGMITNYAHIGQHSEASLGYFLFCTRPPKGRKEKKACADLVNEWQSMPGDTPHKLTDELDHERLKASWF